MKTSYVFNRDLLWLVVATALTLQAALNAAEIPKLVAAKISRPPVLNGKAGDSAWTSAKPVHAVADGVMPKTRGTSSTVTVRAAHADTPIMIPAI